MVTPQWGTIIGYDILVYDKAGSLAFREVKSSARYAGRWILQKKKPCPQPIGRRSPGEVEGPVRLLSASPADRRTRP